MTAPRTRVGEGASEFERELLRAWGHEKPSARARNRTLGLVGGAAVGITSSGTAAGAVAAAPKATALGLAVVKWVVAGSLVAVGAVAVAPHVLSRSAPASPAASGSTPAVPPGATPDPRGRPPWAVAASAPSPVDGPVALAPPPLPVPDLASPAPVARAVPASMIPSPVAAALVSPSESEPPPARSLGEAHASRALGDQVASIDRARAALAAGDAREAVAQTDDYEARFPHGSLLQEATVLRVEALLRLGDRSRAHEVGERFLAAYPTSPHAARVRQMLSPNQNP